MFAGAGLVFLRNSYEADGPGNEAYSSKLSQTRVFGM